ncbi:hypothetical protein D3C78_1370520 [compost metagenome]
MDGELLQLLLIPFRVAARLGARLRRHLGDAEAQGAVAKGWRFPGGEGQIQGRRKQPPGADELHQLAIGHGHLGLQAAGAGAQPRE